MRMVPTRMQWQKWSLPSKATYVATVISVISLAVALFALMPAKETVQGPTHHTAKTSVGPYKLVIQLKAPNSTDWIVSVDGEIRAIVKAGQSNVEITLPMEYHPSDSVRIELFAEGHYPLRRNVMLAGERRVIITFP